jgi:hypothetical protein
MNRSDDVGSSGDDSLSWSPDFNYAKALGIQTPDRVLGSVFILGTLIGFFGNGSAVCYFWPRRRKTIHDLLYLTVTAVDFLTVSACFPLITSLLNDRHPMLFKNSNFCAAWVSVILFTTRMSMFLAMLICITRTIAMKCPQRIIKQKSVIGAIIGYASYMILFYLIYLPQKWHLAEYLRRMSSCALTVGSGDHLAPPIASYIGMISLAIEFTLPSLIAFVCFIVGIWVLMTRPSVGNENSKTFRRVSITIIIFTAAFLLCNMPCFLFMIWEYSSFLTTLKGPLQVLNRGYAELFLQYFPIYLNAVINPILYVSRMRGYQKWISQMLKNLCCL